MIMLQLKLRKYTLEEIRLQFEDWKNDEYLYLFLSLDISGYMSIGLQFEIGRNKNNMKYQVSINFVDNHL